MLRPKYDGDAPDRWPAYHDLPAMVRAILVDLATDDRDLERRLPFGPTVREYLEANGAAILAQHISEAPGTRPRWWYLRAEGLGRFKVLRRLDPPARFEPFEIRESEAAYLHRHGMLTAAESKLWRAGTLDREELTWPAYLAPDGRAPVGP